MPQILMEINSKIKINKDIILKDNVLMDNLLTFIERFKTNPINSFLLNKFRSNMKIEQGMIDIL